MFPYSSHAHTHTKLVQHILESLIHAYINSIDPPTRRHRLSGVQGEVEQIAMMKPKGLTEHEDGLLEYLEDIIGSDRFVEAAEEAAKKVEELNDQRTEKVF